MFDMAKQQEIDHWQACRHTFSIKSRLRSFRYAVRGAMLMLRTQHNAWLHAAATLIIIAIGLLFRVDHDDWCWLVLAMVAVWTAESLNTALEFLADVASPEFHPLVEKAKDVAAGAVLVSAFGAVVIGAMVLGPYLLAYFVG